LLSLDGRGGKDETAESLREAGVKVAGPVGTIEHSGDGIRAVLRGVQTLSFDVVYPALGCGVRSDLASALGAKTNNVGCLEVDSRQCTTVPGIYAAGDVVSDLHQIAVAAGHAAVAATHIHKSLPENFKGIDDVVDPAAARNSVTACHKSRPCAGSSGTPADSFLNHRSITAATYANSAGRSAWPFPMACHFARQPRQHVAVACCAMNTGCPLKGVCLTSFRGLAAPNRFTRRPSASASTAFKPFLSRYLNSSGPSRKRRRNADLAKSSKSWPMSFVVVLRQSRVTLDARTKISSWQNSRSRSIR
jgi:hypothetical protein